MIIDAAKLKEIDSLDLHPMIDDLERWYLLPTNQKYALSTSSNLARLEPSASGERWKVQKRHFLNGSDGYYLRMNDNDNDVFVTIGELFNMVFFSDLVVYRIVPQKSYPVRTKNGYSVKWSLNAGSKKKILYSYHVRDCHILLTKNEYTEYLKSKLDGRSPNYPTDRYRHEFINRCEECTHQKIISDWHNVTGRATDPNRKRRRPDNIDNTICNEWLDFSLFSQWYREHRYTYTGTFGELQLDKDTLKFCDKKEYSPQRCCFLPAQINARIRKTCNDRLARACFLREFINIERERGEVPKYILDALEEWERLDRTEKGKIILGG